MKKELKYIEVAADWKDTSDLLDNFKVALKNFGLYLIDDPRYEGSDMIGVLISNRKITKKELEKIDEKG